MGAGFSLEEIGNSTHGGRGKRGRAFRTVESREPVSRILMMYRVFFFLVVFLGSVCMVSSGYDFDLLSSLSLVFGFGCFKFVEPLLFLMYGMCG